MCFGMRTSTMKDTCLFKVLLGKKGNTLTFHHFFHTPTYLNKHLLAFHPFFLLNLSILFQEIQFKLNIKHILEYRNVKSAKTNKLTFGHAWLLLCMDWGWRWQAIMELFLDRITKGLWPYKRIPSKGPKVAVCHQERKILSQINVRSL